ncbi:cation diffusion facilitator family transporter [Niabella ginsengisoli]|uniref:Cation diffusion facilitator family transporter n=1 Tax=Niabella ginsengisoli TaxID=522298 RepID=A0ABS9SQL1_9BACT|nr:cation diffusion facilitator family transporter [Niabella ginsengisoli]MCH5600409.1 cation diffusion facilitator family transporter [Niabella ginsengisoli]
MKQTAPQRQNFRMQRWVAVVSVVLLAVKFVAYYYTSSVAVLTDAMESIVNVIAGLIGLYSLYVAAQPRDQNHPYGHGKAEFLSAAIEGILIGIAGIFILYEAIYKLVFPEAIKKTDIGIILIGATAVINYALGVFCVRLGRKNNSLALEASGKHLQTDTYSTIAVIIGLIIMHFTQLIWVDAVVAILLSLFIIYTSYHITRRSIAGIMDEADTSLLTDMVDLINRNRSNNWVDMHNLRVIKYGSILHIDAHLTVPWYFTVKQAHHEVDIFSDLIRKNYGASLELFIHSDGCIEGPQCPICINADCPVRKQVFTKKIEWTLENVLKNKRHNTQTTSLIL